MRARSQTRPICPINRRISAFGSVEVQFIVKHKNRAYKRPEIKKRGIMEFVELQNIGTIANLDKFAIVSVVREQNENGEAGRVFVKLKIGKTHMLVNAAQADELIKTIREARYELSKYTTTANG